MSIEWTPSAPFCPSCGGPNIEEVACGSCDYKPGDPLFDKDGLFTKEELKIKVAVLESLGHPIKRRLKRFR